MLADTLFIFNREPPKGWLKAVGGRRSIHWLSYQSALLFRGTLSSVDRWQAFSGTIQISERTISSILHPLPLMGEWIWNRVGLLFLASVLTSAGPGVPKFKASLEMSMWREGWYVWLGVKGEGAAGALTLNTDSQPPLHSARLDPGSGDPQGFGHRVLLIPSALLGLSLYLGCCPASKALLKSLVCSCLLSWSLGTYWFTLDSSPVT